MLTRIRFGLLLGVFGVATASVNKFGTSSGGLVNKLASRFMAELPVSLAKEKSTPTRQSKSLISNFEVSTDSGILMTGLYPKNVLPIPEELMLIQATDIACCARRQEIQ